ncbi:MAG: endonuclease III [Sphaerochaetaceae bacterium]|nr:endonuclease III [Sphaerochaetaceae bacterium]
MDLTAFNILSDSYPEDIKFLVNDDNFQFIICVILSAQTTDKRVMEVTPMLFEKYPNAASLAKADLEAVEEIIRPLGFFRAKARNIIGFAHEVDRLGYIPDSIEELVKLPGVGRKTANCYLEHIGRPAVIVDTHFKRVCYRLGYTDSKDPDKVEKDIRRIAPEEKWSRMSMVLNAYGRDVCHSQRPDCENCRVSSYCKRR